MSSGVEIHLYCEEISALEGDCNRHTVLKVNDRYEAIQHYIRTSEWGIVDGEVRCPDHK